MTDPAAVKLGRKGGKAGKGASKRRGDADYYRKLVAMRKDRRKAVQLVQCDRCGTFHNQGRKHRCKK